MGWKEHECSFCSLRGNYTTGLGKSILYCNFITNSLKYIKIYIIRKGILQGRHWWCRFSPKLTILRKLQKKKTNKFFFLPFCFWNRLEKKSKFQKLLLKRFIDLKHPFECCVSHCCKYLATFWVSCHLRQKVPFFYNILKFLT